jgi:Ti type entry exclusion protein TrbK
VKAIGIIVVLALAVGGLTTWLTVDHTRPEAREAFFGPDQTYDATGGQQMGPRW